MGFGPDDLIAGSGGGGGATTSPLSIVLANGNTTGGSDLVQTLGDKFLAATNDGVGGNPEYSWSAFPTSGIRMEAGGVMDFMHSGFLIMGVSAAATGLLMNAPLDLRGNNMVMSLGGPIFLDGAGTPEASITADVGSLYIRNDGGAGTTLYTKESGVGNTGWVAVSPGGSTWAASLTAGASSGANNPQIDTGQFLLGQTGLDLRTTGAADLTLRTGATTRLTAFGADGHIEVVNWLRVGGSATSVANALGDFAAGDSVRFIHYDANLNGGTLRLDAGTSSFVVMNGAGYIEGHTETTVTNAPVTVAQTSLRSTGITADGFGLQIRHQIEGLASGQINAAIFRTTWDSRAGMDAFYDIKVAGNGGGAGGADAVTLALRCRGTDLSVEVRGGLEVGNTGLVAAQGDIFASNGINVFEFDASVGQIVMDAGGGALIVLNGATGYMRIGSTTEAAAIGDFSAGLTNAQRMTWNTSTQQFTLFDNLNSVALRFEADVITAGADTNVPTFANTPTGVAAAQATWLQCVIGGTPSYIPVWQ